jgi:hypothetical protein
VRARDVPETIKVDQIVPSSPTNELRTAMLEGSFPHSAAMVIGVKPYRYWLTGPATMLFRPHHLEQITPVQHEQTDLSEVP